MKVINLRKYDVRNRWKDNEDRQLLIVGGLFVAQALWNANYNAIASVAALIAAVYALPFLYGKIKNVFDIGDEKQ